MDRSCKAWVKKLLRELAIQFCDLLLLEPLIVLDLLGCHYFLLGEDISTSAKNLSIYMKAMASVLSINRASRENFEVRLSGEIQ